MALKPSSRARLNRTTLDQFPKDTLFDALGRAVSEAECLPRKEFFETWAVAKRVRRRLKGGPIVELAAGHGLLAYMLLLLDKSSGPAICLDRRRPKSADRLAESLCKAWPRLADQVSYREESLTGFEVPEGALVVSVHACGRLTDKVLDVAIGARARVAVVPCCQNLRLCDTAGLEAWLEGRLAIDVVRALRLRDAGYAIHAQTISDEITPQNRLLIGVPKA